jgi:predicted transcriptional regulator
MKYRSRTEIASRVLESAVEGTTKTRIMYKAFLSYSQLQEYLAVLEENKTTEKGKRFLDITNSLRGMMETIPNLH